MSRQLVFIFVRKAFGAAVGVVALGRILAPSTLIPRSLELQIREATVHTTNRRSTRSLQMPKLNTLERAPLDFNSTKHVMDLGCELIVAHLQGKLRTDVSII